MESIFYSIAIIVVAFIFKDKDFSINIKHEYHQENSGSIKLPTEEEYDKAYEPTSETAKEVTELIQNFLGLDT